MKTQYVHFTDEEGAENITSTGKLLECSYNTGVYAVNLTSGEYCPEIQRSELGRAKDRDYAVVFSTDEEPAYEFPEESVWCIEELYIKNAKIITAMEAISLLNKGE